jgi:DNA-binding PadR family transcriptional regulator
MAMKDAVLGLIVERRGYGYDLIRRFNERFGEAWDLNQSTVYAALDALEKDGCIVGHERGSTAQRERARSQRQTIVTYDATSRGKDKFLTWLTAPVAEIDPVRADIFLKIGTTTTPQQALPLIQVLDAQIDAHANELARHLSRYHLDIGNARHVEWLAAVPWFMTEAAITRLQGDLNWLRRVRIGAEAFRAHGFIPLADLPTPRSLSLG